MKIWHDDVRKPPADWWWVRTNLEAVAALVYYHGEITEISLDHDLGLDHVDPDEYSLDPTELWRLQGDSKQGDGRELVKWMVKSGHVPPKVTIHSWNPDGANEMAYLFRDKGYSVTIASFNPLVSWA